MTRDEAELLVRSLRPDDAARLFKAGLDLLDADFPELLAPVARAAARRHRTDPRMQQLFALASRAAGDSAAALNAFAAAAALAPNDALIAHSHARAALEAGQPAVALFDRARHLAPADGSVLQGRAAAQLAEGQGAQAIADLAAVIRQNPLWLDGQRSLAHLVGQLGGDPAAELATSIATMPDQPDLHRLHIATLLEAGDLTRAEAAAAEAASRLGQPGWLGLVAAHIASEQGAMARADRLFAALAVPDDLDAVSLLARHLIRAGRPDTARDLIEPWTARDPDNLLWPYRSLAWRLTGDRRWQWLEGDPRLVAVHDLADRIDDLAGLAEHLRSLHVARAAPLDQSVRGGTQTDGNLLLRTEAPIARLRALILETVAAHVAQLPAADAGHPTLLARRAPLRIAGSWSVRLQGSGFHTDHVHSQGWVSSALYVALPDRLGDVAGPDSHAGWLSLGECRDLLPELEPIRLVEPKPGRLVLFPSTMWHGTRAFPAGERMTVAFDIARPRQS